MVIREFLQQISLFENLTEADIDGICGLVEEVRLAAGEELFAEGDQGDRAYIIKDGQVEVIKTSGGNEVLLDVPALGSVIGEMALLEQTRRMASVRARTDSVLLVIHHDQFENLLNTSSSAARALLDTVLTRWRNTEAMLRQRERMAQLGTLSAGVAHELNNPAAAVKRGADQLKDAIEQLERGQRQLEHSGFTSAQWETLQALGHQARRQAMQPTALDVIVRGDRESELETWLEARGVVDAWEYVPTLVSLGYDTAELARLAGHFGADRLAAVISWLDATYRTNSLLDEMAQGAGRISEIVTALKAYSYLDQAPVQAVDLHEGLDNTLVMMRHKLVSGIAVRRDYAPDLPKIQACGGDLNQVWTNIIDNAADALDGSGQLVIRTRHDSGWVVVEIEDNGPGIPPEIQPRLFDPFFTTKPPGQGTGLGLDITYNIVVHRHRGDISVISQPGKTCFQVRLPINFEMLNR